MKICILNADGKNSVDKSWECKKDQMSSVFEVRRNGIQLTGEDLVLNRKNGTSSIVNTRKVDSVSIDRGNWSTG